MNQLYYLVLAVFFTFSFFSSALAANRGNLGELSNSLAQAKCRSLHHQDAEPASAFGNSSCFLRCVIHGRSTLHQVNEGQACPSSPSGICRLGACIQQQRLGIIDVEVVSASLSQRANAYANVCIQNSSTLMTLPIKNRASCVTCVTNPVNNSLNPVWNSVCAKSGKHLFVQESRVSIELWDNHGVGAANKVFLGGVSLTIPQLLSQGDSHRELHLSLAGGVASGLLNFRVTWTGK
ncbi:hypothetical protein TYRP_020584 [Tyrophagus putrescentiae]|nr:hypothetical protein TYRP_020584 [Tyrophagus putrescentiae]WCD24778.1 Tyr p 36 allergen [Tyrophagus putrescentiae]